MVIRCIDGCKFYMRISKRDGKQYWQVVTLYRDHTSLRTNQNRQVKIEWLG